MPCPVSYYNSWHDVSVEEKKVLSANRYLGQVAHFILGVQRDLNVLNLNERPLLD